MSDVTDRTDGTDEPGRTTDASYLESVLNYWQTFLIALVALVIGVYGALTPNTPAGYLVAFAALAAGLVGFAVWQMEATDVGPA
jgi:hypothetical protein